MYWMYVFTKGLTYMKSLRFSDDNTSVVRKLHLRAFDFDLKTKFTHVEAVPQFGGGGNRMNRAAENEVFSHSL